jgi:hypothetical protein
VEGTGVEECQLIRDEHDIEADEYRKQETDAETAAEHPIVFVDDD